jgi:hypothetical protein
MMKDHELERVPDCTDLVVFPKRRGKSEPVSAPVSARGPPSRTLLESRHMAFRRKLLPACVFHLASLASVPTAWATPAEDALRAQGTDDRLEPSGPAGSALLLLGVRPHDLGESKRHQLRHRRFRTGHAV